MGEIILHFRKAIYFLLLLSLLINGVFLYEFVLTRKLMSQVYVNSIKGARDVMESGKVPSFNLTKAYISGLYLDRQFDFLLDNKRIRESIYFELDEVQSSSASLEQQKEVYNIYAANIDYNQVFWSFNRVLPGYDKIHEILKEKGLEKYVLLNADQKTSK